MTKTNRIVIYTPGLTPRKAIVTAIREHLRLLQIQAEGRTLSPLLDAVERISFAIPRADTELNIEVVGPAIGGPVAELLIDKLAYDSPFQLLLFGIAGGIPQGSLDLQIGDSLSPSTVCRLSKPSPPEKKFTKLPIATRLQSSLATAAQKIFLRHQSVEVWSVDSLSEESPENIQRAKSEGISSVDMELYSVVESCHRMKIECAAQFVVSDLLNTTGDFQGIRMQAGPIRRALREQSQFLVNWIYQQ